MKTDEKDQWYSIAENDTQIWQGDFLDNFLVPFPNDVDVSQEQPRCSYQLIPMDAVIVSQSCDLTSKVQEDDQVVLCERHFLADVFQSKTQLKKEWPDLVKDRVVDKLLLDKFDNSELGFDYSFVDFSKIYVVPYDYVASFISGMQKRVKMKSPYRERLSQAFARKFMRVGLPVDIARDIPEIEFKAVTAYGQEGSSA